MTRLAGLAPLFLATCLVAACRGEDRPTQVTAATPGGPGTPAAVGTACPGATGSVSGAAPTGSVSGPGCPQEGGAAPGVVMLKPRDATQVDAVLSEWGLATSAPQVKAGKIYFLADNKGPNLPHELVIVKTDFAPDQLPVESAKVPEDKVTIVGEIEGFAPLSQASGLFDLAPGNYVLICNLRDLVGFEYQSHYREGMRASFKVTE